MSAGKPSPAAPRYPEITVDFSTRDGNVFVLIGAVIAALRDNDVPRETIDEFRREVMSAGSYQMALQTMMKWVEVR